MNYKKIIPLIAVAALSGCASTKNVDVMTYEKIDAPKVVALQGTRASWVYVLEKKLNQAGFETKRFASQNIAIQKENEVKTSVYNESSARFVLNIDGIAPDDSFRRCYGGGYNFEYINVELIDVKSNKTIFHYSNSGYSENCPPLSGHIFGDITNLMLQAWK